MTALDVARDLTFAGTTLTGLGLGIKFVIGKVTDWLAARERRLGAEAKAGAAKARADDDTAQHAIKLAGEQAHRNAECLELVREQGIEIGKVRREVGDLREQLGATRSTLKHCEERHDEKDGQMLVMRAQLDRLLSNSEPPPIAAE